MLTAIFAVAAVIGLGIGVWGEVSEQRRLARMARECEIREARS